VVGGPYGAAARLGLKRTTLVARMKKHGILRLPDESDVEQAFNNKRSSNRVC
jgi:formate hydrogenlyase transcriptional activator